MQVIACTALAVSAAAKNAAAAPRSSILPASKSKGKNTSELVLIIGLRLSLFIRFTLKRDRRSPQAPNMPLF